MNQEQFNQVNQELKTNKLGVNNYNDEIKTLIDSVILPMTKAISTWDAMESLSISIATLDDGTGKIKSIYPNQEARSAELICRQSTSPERKAWVDKQEEAEKSIAKYRAEIRLLDIDCYFMTNQINWGISHASDEINDLIANVSDNIDIMIDRAAENAIRRVIKYMDSTA